MESHWKKRMGKDPAEIAKLAIATDAGKAGCLIYSVNTGKWYTPKQFMKADIETVFIKRGRDNGEKIFKIMRPEAGIKQKLDNLQRAETELREFMATVIDVFALEAKQKT